MIDDRWFNLGDVSTKEKSLVLLWYKWLELENMYRDLYNIVTKLADKVNYLYIWEKEYFYDINIEEVIQEKWFTNKDKEIYENDFHKIIIRNELIQIFNDFNNNNNKYSYEGNIEYL